MTREEAAVYIAETFEWVMREYENHRADRTMMQKTTEAFDVAIAALHGPEPDPETGLVPCGCGERVSIAFYPAWAGKPDLYQVDCFSCHVGTRPCQTAEQAKAAWNTAMGHKGGAE